jgi:hypothetical protein
MQAPGVTITAINSTIWSRPNYTLYIRLSVTWADQPQTLN